MLLENGCSSLCCSREQRPLAVVLSSKKASWSVDIKLKRRIVTFKMDTGAGNTSSWESLRKVIWGPIQTLDQFMWWLKYCKRSARQSVYMVKGLKTNLLVPVGHHCLTVGMSDWCDKPEEPDIVKRFPQTFEGHGTIAQGQCNPPNVPITLWLKVEQELNWMEWLGVISRVTTPAAWCAGIVSPKRRGRWGSVCTSNC